MLKLKKELSARHILMIAMGSAIGTGFFFGTGQAIHLAGPSILLAYLLGGMVMYIIVRALGEMSVAEPNSGSFSYYAYRYIGHYAGFISGWNYWFNYIIVCMLELSACSLFMDYWFIHSQHWLITLTIMSIFTLINLAHVGLFGEIEFWFAGIKVVTIIGFILFGLYIIGFQPQPDHRSSLSNLWSHGGFFVHGPLGFLSSLVVVVFSFGGTELVGMAAGETQNPQKNIPRAINAIIFRIILFYVFTLAIVMCLYPWDQLNANISPFVDVFKQMGIMKAASLINVVAITAALSSLNSGIYGTARMLHHLGLQGDAPRLVTRLSKNGAPRNATLISMACIAFTILLNYFYPQQIFNMLLAIATIAAIMNWIAILVTHICFKRAFNKTSHYPLFGYPYTSLIAIVCLIIVAVTMSFLPEFRLAIWIAPVWLTLLTIGYWLKNRGKI
jgi:AAT family amino acid transporter